MTVTKTYAYFIQFARGSADIIREQIYTLSLEQALIRAQGIPGHRIVIEAHGDRADPCKTGAAMRRLEVLRHHFTAGSITEDRLELQTHAEMCCPDTSKYHESYCRADIYTLSLGGKFVFKRWWSAPESQGICRFTISTGCHV